MLKASAPTGCCRTRQVQAICCVTGGASTSCRSLGITPGPAACLGTSVDTCPCPGTCSGDIGNCPALEWSQNSCQAGLGAAWWQFHGFMGCDISSAGLRQGAWWQFHASWAVTSTLQVSGRELGSCFTDSWSDLYCASPARASRWAPVPGRCWLWHTELFALTVLAGTLFHNFCSWCCPSQCGTAKLGPKGALQAQSDQHWAMVPWAPLALLWEQLPLQGGQVLPCCCAGFVTVRLMLVIGSFYHLNVSSQLLKPASARIYYLADKYKCRFILSPCSSERNENVSKIVKIK